VKALRCLNCKTYIVVLDGSVAYCSKCNIPLQEDNFLKIELKLEKDEPIKRKYVKKEIKKKPKKKTKKTKRKNKNKIKKRKRKPKNKTKKKK